jgi:rubredoxin
MTAYRACDVCVLVYNDSTPKWVEWCQVCHAWLCRRCRSDPVARVKAALIRAWKGG